MANDKQRWAYNCRELIAAPVIRKHLHVEWLTKLSAKDFKKWEFYTRERYSHNTDLTEAELHAKVWEEIEDMENRYQLTKEKLALEKKLLTHNKKFERDYKNDMLYKLNTYDNIALPSNEEAYLHKREYDENGMSKYVGKIKLGVVLTKYNEVNKNGRIYPSPTATTKQNYYGDWF